MGHPAADAAAAAKLTAIALARKANIALDNDFERELAGSNKHNYFNDTDVETFGSNKPIQRVWGR